MKSKPIKICFIADTHDLYDDRIYWKEAVSLKNHGYDINFILAADQEEEGITKEGIHFQKVKRKVYCKYRFINFLIKRMIPNGLFHEIFNKAVETKSDLYHLHDLKASQLVGKLKKLNWQPKVIYDVHEPHYENIIDYNKTKGITTFLKRLYAWHIKKKEQKIIRHCDFVITTEENLRDRFRMLLPHDRVDIIYNYTDMDIVSDTIPVKERKYDVIYTGGITTFRGVWQILAAIKIALKTIPELKLLLLGKCFPASLKDELHKFIIKNNLQDNIKLKGFVPYKEVSEFYKDSKIGLGIFLPIPTHKIILQIKIFEYMNFGLPIIGSNFGHIGNIIAQDQVGISVDSESPEEIATAILNLLEDEKLYSSFSDNGKRAVESKYRWKYMENRLISIYEKILAPN